ncbi:MAG: phytanoyl-CoA dioxygenase family protein [Candidatus Binataceae bacterium]
MFSLEQKAAWERDGFFIIRGFAHPHEHRALHDRVVEIVRTTAAAGNVPNVMVMPERRPNPLAINPEDQISKVFRLHRDPVFQRLVEDSRYCGIVSELLGPEIDCFVSQYIFKNNCALGQPWHQDSYYFAFDRRPQVGMWLAITEATLDNGCLHVLPGSHREPVHEHVRDRRTYAQYGYQEIVDHDMSASVPVLMSPGDLLVFHSHLMHCSTDNLSGSPREAIVWHYAATGTKDLTKERFGYTNPTHDFMTVKQRER